MGNTEETLLHAVIITPGSKSFSASDAHKPQCWVAAQINAFLPVWLPHKVTVGFVEQEKQKKHIFLFLSQRTLASPELSVGLCHSLALILERLEGIDLNKAGNIPGRVTSWAPGSQVAEVRRKPSRYGGEKGQEVKGQWALKLRVHGSKQLGSWCWSPLFGINWNYHALCWLVTLCTVIISFSSFLSRWKISHTLKTNTGVSTT